MRGTIYIGGFHSFSSNLRHSSIIIISIIHVSCLANNNNKGIVNGSDIVGTSCGGKQL